MNGLVGSLTSPNDHNLSEHHWKHSPSSCGSAAPVVSAGLSALRYNGADCNPGGWVTLRFHAENIDMGYGVVHGMKAAKNFRGDNIAYN
jgi:hypothetical protein